MAIHTTCPSCRTSCNLPDAMAGTTVHCQECGRPFVAPQARPEDHAVMPLPVARIVRKDGPDTPRRKERSGFPVVLFVVLGGGALLLVGLVVGIAVLFFSSSSQSGKSDAPPAVVGVAKPLQEPALPFVPGFPQLPEGGEPPKPPDFPLLPPDRPDDGARPPEPKPPQPELPKRVEQEEEEPTVPWRVRPDPMPEPIEGPFDLNASISLFLVPRVIFPSRPSVFVAISATDVREPNRLRVWDLRRMKPVGALIDTMLTERPALSPDGLYLAARGNRKEDKPSVCIWSVATGALLRTIEVDNDPKIRVGRLDFAGKGRLLTAKHESDHPLYEAKTTYQVWDIETGREVAHFDVDLVFDPKWASISAGGRYLALEETDGGRYWMHFYDLTTGRLAAKFHFQSEHDPWGVAGGIAFSRDGKEVAMLWGGARKPALSRLMCWDMASGKKVLDHPSPRVHPALDVFWGDGGARTFQWLPDGKGWLLSERLVFDRATGAFVGDIAPDMRLRCEVRDRRFLDRDHFSVLVPTTRGAQLRVIKVPAPSTKTPEETSQAGPVTWQVKPDPPAQPVEGPFDLEGFVPLNGLSQIIYPLQRSPFAAAPSTDPKTPDRMRVWDLRTMKPIGPAVQADPRAYAAWVLSPDGSHLAAKVRENIKPTVHIWSGKTGERVRAIEVDPDFQIGLEWFDFADKDHLVTGKHDSNLHSRSGQTIYQVWDIKTGKEATHFCSPVAFQYKWAGISPGGRYLLLGYMWHGHSDLVFFDLTTGKLVGKSSLPVEKGALGHASGVAFSPDGKEAAMLWRYARGATWGRVFSWDLATGKTIRDHKIGHIHPTLDNLWLEGDYRAFQWLPDGKAWLLWERLVIDRDSGASLGDIDPDRGDSRQTQQRRFLDRDHFCILAPSRTDPQLRVRHLPGARPASHK